MVKWAQDGIGGKLNTIFSALRSSLNDVLTAGQVLELCETALSELDSMAEAFAAFRDNIATTLTERAGTIDRDGPFSRADEEEFVNELKDTVEEFTFTLGK